VLCLFHVSRGLERHAQDEASVEPVIAFHQSKEAEASRTLGWVSAASNAANGASRKVVLRVNAPFMLAMLPFDRSD
jgi:hypothetical protein